MFKFHEFMPIKSQKLKIKPHSYNTLKFNFAYPF